MALFDKALFVGKLAAKTTLFVGEAGLRIINEGAKAAVKKGVEPGANYQEDACKGMADSLSNLNKKIKLFPDNDK